MKIALVVQGPYAKDGMFDPNSPVNRDDAAAPFRLLKQELERHGHDFHTLDVFEGRNETADVALFLEIPREPVSEVLSRHRTAEAWVVLLESAVVLPRNWDRSRHADFSRLFTWNDEVVDEERYFKLNFPNPFPVLPPVTDGVRDRFATMIAGNKSSAHPLELYSARVDTIRWFELNHPDQFDLYGIGWDSSAGVRGIRRHVDRRRRQITGRRAFPSWRGAVDAKLPTLAKYRFAVCYENAHQIPGYITEKLFDCFFAGTVPVYWGAPNIAEHVDPASFIDRTLYSSHESLYEYLSSMDEPTYRAFQQAGAGVVRDQREGEYSGTWFVKTLLRHVASAEVARRTP